MFPKLLIDLQLFLKMEGVEHFKEEGDGYGGGLAVLLEGLVLVETIIPVIDLLMQVVFDELCVLELAVIDVDQFLQTDELVLVEVILILNYPDFLFLHV